ncbi:hypothetical protein HW132_32965 [Brasilonema sp. CT11]|nr:hypothetical protein [Brasilonema sp. CT11]
MQFAFAIELFLVVFSILCCLVTPPKNVKVENEIIINVGSSNVNEIEKTLSNVVLQLQQIENSGLIKRIAALPEAHPEIETIMGDALHYSLELKLRINQFISNQTNLPLSIKEVTNTSLAKQDYSIWDSLAPIHVEQDFYVGVIEKLNATQARKTASLLKKKGIIDQSKKLSGKGIGRDWLIFLIQDHLPAHQQEVKQALQAVLKRELL